MKSQKFRLLTQRNNRVNRKFSTLKDNDVVVCSFARTPITKIGGSLSSLSAPKIGAEAIKAAVSRFGDGKYIEEAYIGNVVSAGIGQAPSRQAVIYAGLPITLPTTDVNKVCASGMKAVILSALSITSGYRNVLLAGGMESMSNIPYYLPGARNGFRLGHNTVVDGIINDGLWDIYNNYHMGNCGEACAKSFNISRQEQDNYAIESYRRAAEAWKSGKYSDEVISIKLENKKTGEFTTISQDEEFTNIKIEKVSTLKPAFAKDGTVTAANASKLNDGAAAMIITSGKFAREHQLKPLFKILGYGDAARDPIEFTIAPADAVPKAYKHAGVSSSDIEYHEINEAFSVVPLANARLLNLDLSKVNVHGGAVALGHPIGCSGARIIGALYNVLKSNDATLGCASICNGGGGASAIVIERLL